jgi:hypothetical protein
MKSFTECSWEVFNESHNKELLPPNDSDSLYVSLIPDEVGLSKMQGIMSDMHLKELISKLNGTLTPLDEYHVTIVYSRTGGNEIYNSILHLKDNTSLLQQTLLAKVEHINPLEFFGNFLVCKLSSLSLDKLHDQCLNNGGSFDFDQYNPHITLAKVDKTLMNTTEFQELRDYVDIINSQDAEELSKDYFSFDSINSEPLKD